MFCVSFRFASLQNTHLLFTGAAHDYPSFLQVVVGNNKKRALLYYLKRAISEFISPLIEAGEFFLRAC